MEIGIIGLGKVAENNYIPSLLRHSDVNLTCYSRTPARAEEIGHKFGVRAVRTLEALFERRPEAVFVLTGEGQRRDAALATLPFKPRRLFFEKPLVAAAGQAHVTPQDFWDAKALLAQAQAADPATETAMVFNYRFFDQIQRAKRLIKERDFGPATTLSCTTHFACWSHCIDLIMHFAGPVREITAQQGTLPRPFMGSGEAADVAASFLIGESATGVLLGTSGMGWKHPLLELTVNFEHGRIHFRDLDQDMEVLDYRDNVHEVFAPVRDQSRWTKYAESFDKSVAAYLAAVRAGAPPPVPGIAGLLELQFEASLKHSIAERRPVRPMEEFPTDPVR